MVSLKTHSRWFATNDHRAMFTYLPLGYNRSDNAIMILLPKLTFLLFVPSILTQCFFCEYPMISVGRIRIITHGNEKSVCIKNRGYYNNKQETRIQSNHNAIQHKRINHFCDKEIR